LCCEVEVYGRTVINMSEIYDDAIRRRNDSGNTNYYLIRKLVLSPANLMTSKIKECKTFPFASGFVYL
jgi:hypothetical protein